MLALIPLAISAWGRKSIKFLSQLAYNSGILSKFVLLDIKIDGIHNML